MSGPPGARASSLVPVAIVGVAATAVVAAAVMPERLDLAGLPGPAQVVALRGLVGVLLAVAGIALGLLALVLRLVRRHATPPQPRGPATTVVTTLAVIALLGAGTECAVLAARGTGEQDITTPATDAQVGDVIVLVQNTLTILDADQLAAEILDRRAHVVVLPETTAATAERTADLVRARSGRELQVLAHAGGSSDISSTALLVDATLGTFSMSRTLPGIQGSFVVATADRGLTITAVHTTSPSGPDLHGWRTSTRAVVGTCGTSSIVAGDFNATIDHPMLRDLVGCVDAALTTGTAGVATWPVALPRTLGAPIDHVLVDPSVWRVVQTSVLDPPAGTDHRGFEAVLRPVDS